MVPVRLPPPRISACLLGGLLLMASMPNFAQSPGQKLSFAAGVDKTHVKGSLKGSRREKSDYLVTLKKGQTLSLELTGNPAGVTFFVVLPPTRPGAPPAHEGEGRSKGSTKAALDGEYTVRVFLTRDAATKGKKSSFTLDASIQ